MTYGITVTINNLTRDLGTIEADDGQAAIRKAKEANPDYNRQGADWWATPVTVGEKMPG